MAEVQTVPAKYIFLDIVGYTKDRSVEAQSEIGAVLSRLVRQAVESQKLKDDSVIYIPTGDGVCIALLKVTDPYDVHMQTAINILDSVDKHNGNTTDEMRRFEIRVGINENVDNLIVDITGNRNVAGAGISMAHRIMDLADGSQILVGHSVFEALKVREKYLGQFRSYDVTIKHGQVVQVHQYVQGNLAGLNVKIPLAMAPRVKPEPKLSKLAAYYFGHAIKLQSFVRSHINGGKNNFSLALLLWFCAYESLNKSEATELRRPYPALTSIPGKDLEEKFRTVQEIPFIIVCKFVELMQRSPDLSPWYHKYFEDAAASVPLYVNERGKEKLRAEWPNIWEELELNQ